MRRCASIAAASVMFVVAPAAAQDQGGRCVTPDSVVVVGNKRVDAANIITESGLVPGVAANYTAIQKAIRTLYESGQFETVWIRCELLDAPAPRTVYQILVAERPVLDNVDVVGPQAISLGT